MTPHYHRTLAGMDSLDRSRKARVAEDIDARLILRDVARHLAGRPSTMALMAQPDDELREFIGRKVKDLSGR